jgi:hypothetical protein
VRGQVEQRGRQDPQDHDDERPGELRSREAQQEQQADRDGADRQRGGVGRTEILHHAHEHVPVRTSGFGYPEDLRQLIDDQAEPDREHEAFEDRFGKEVRDPPHPEHAEEDVDDADAQRERDDGRQVVG